MQSRVFAPVGQSRALAPKSWSCCCGVFVLLRLAGAISDRTARISLCIRASPTISCGIPEEGAQQALINYKPCPNPTPASGNSRELLRIYIPIHQSSSSSRIQDRFPTTEADPAGILLGQQNSNHFHLTPTDRAAIPSQHKGQESSSSHII